MTWEDVIADLPLRTGARRRGAPSARRRRPARGEGGPGARPREEEGGSALGKGKGRTRFSLWNILSIVALAVLCVTTFQPVIMATIVHPDLGGNIFSITSYVSGLTSMYAPWLSQMMSEGTGERTSMLLQVGTVLLYLLCIVAVAAIVAAAASIVLNAFGKRRAGRITGIIGFALGLLVPIACIAIVQVVQLEMTSDLISITVLSVGEACYVQIAACVVGIVGTVLATHRIADPKQEAAEIQNEEEDGDEGAVPAAAEASIA